MENGTAEVAKVAKDELKPPSTQILIPTCRKNTEEGVWDKPPRSQRTQRRESKPQSTQILIPTCRKYAEEVRSLTAFKYLTPPGLSQNERGKLGLEILPSPPCNSVKICVIRVLLKTPLRKSVYLRVPVRRADLRPLILNNCILLF